MSFSKKVYRIRNKKTDSFISIGYSQKSAWLTFTSSVIKNNPHIINEKTKDNFEVEEYEMVCTKKYTIDKKEIEE